jgi:hypothetical protein
MVKKTGWTLLAALLVPAGALGAGPRLAPPPLEVPGEDARAVFVDFTRAEYFITYDVPAQETRVTSVITFDAPEAGFPIYDLVPAASEVMVDGKAVTETELTPAEDAEPVKVLHVFVAGGPHELRVTHRLKDEAQAPVFKDGTVHSGFFMNDDEGRYLQYYLPSNHEFDAYAMTFHVEIIGSQSEPAFFTNGTLTRKDATHWKVAFPDWYNTSSVFFNTRPRSSVRELPFAIEDGALPVVQGLAYLDAEAPASLLEEFRDGAIAAVREFQGRFGPFPHRQLVIRGTSFGGGMEYAGATVSSMWALKHEIAHSYWGRGVMPANGNAGWIDEAMATLTGGPYSPSTSVATTNMAAHSPYYTANDGHGYGQGMNFLYVLGERFHAANPALSMDGFLATWLRAREHAVVTTEDLRDHLEAYSGKDLDADFQRYVYGVDRAARAARPADAARARVHLRLTPEQLRQLQ